MSILENCPFCDSSEEKIRTLPATFAVKKALDSVCYYFPNFTYTHLKNLCNSCFQYLQNFLHRKNIWLLNEEEIQSKRQLGQFKGLKHMRKRKKSSSLVCRLCLKENNPEDVIFIYLDNEFYQPGYIQKIMCLHASDIDINLTENPVICQECLDVIQTFDALYQMIVENQAEKEHPDFLLKDRSKSTVHQGHSEIVHVQLKRVKDNSLVLSSVTEEESAVSTLLKNKETSDSNIILNGWTMKKVFDVMNKRNSKEKEERKNIHAISDEEEAACSTLSDNEATLSNDCYSEKEIAENDSYTDNKEKGISIGKHRYHDDSNVQSTNDIIEINDSDEEPMTFIKLQNAPTYRIEEGKLLYDESQMNIYDDSLSNENNKETEFEALIVGDSTGSVEELSEDAPSNSREFQLSKEYLEQDLSDFLQFDKSSCIETKSDCSKTSSETQAVSNAKKAKLSGDLSDGSLSNTENSDQFLTVYQKFLKDSQSPTITGPAWKSLRGYVFADSKDDDYCIWFPYYSDEKKRYPSKKVLSYATVLENRQGSRIYRCNICFKVMSQESSISVHKCREARRRLCHIRGCKFYTFNKYLFLQHENAHILLSPEQIRLLKCSFCEYFSSDSNFLEKHMKTIHTKGAISGEFLKCAFCFFTSDKPSIIEHHQAVRHSDKKTKFSKERFG